jgi:hypothetical protein
MGGVMIVGGLGGSFVGAGLFRDTPDHRPDRCRDWPSLCRDPVLDRRLMLIDSMRSPRLLPGRPARQAAAAPQPLGSLRFPTAGASTLRASTSRPSRRGPGLSCRPP